MQKYYYKLNQVLKLIGIIIKTRIISAKPKFKSFSSTSFQKTNRLFVLAFEDDAQRTRKKRCYLPNVEIKEYSGIIDGRKFF